MNYNFLKYFHMKLTPSKLKFNLFASIMLFSKYGVFFQELSIFCDLSFANTGLLLAVQNGHPIRVSAHSDLLQG